ncbi:cytochrome P450 monooxygenase oxidoreductase [Fusarium beomiforme]|uniref:Choline monooxygenase, chloroplastic n=1 Tax=Fusarium beomiforme TaxID=44412 RepID=A0A9P5AA02_9HYPO|nr:cytochrome P450 monooxygenase oxidoreductase [Fusarium beomiforme]
MSLSMSPSFIHYLFSAAGLAAFITMLAKYLSRSQPYREPVPTFLKDTSKTARALPASWYRSQEVYELERRAIFARKWILTTHKLRFTEAGSWVKFEQAAFQFFLVKNKQAQINGFHNICRHRAFPIMTEDKGKSSILSCKYHGWSYGLSGQLAKAPGYDDMKGFDKTKNGLLPIHVHVDAIGFVWVNLDSSKTPENFSTEFKNIDQMARHKGFNFKDYHFDHAWGMSGDYNWKTLADNYNECYHCKAAHPDAADVADLSAYRVDTKDGNIEHFANTKPDMENKGLKIVSNYYFPNACMTVSPNFFYMMRCVPTSPSHCSMEYEVYRHKNATDEDFNTIDAMFKRILAEDKWLCNNAQKNLNAGVFVNGEMHPKMEQGSLYFQYRVRGILNDHYKLEKATGKEINPAQHVPSDASRGTENDMVFCSGLACGKVVEQLAW